MEASAIQKPDSGKKRTESGFLHILKVRVPAGVNSLDEIHVKGGRCLDGKLNVQGSKNTVLPVMAASLLQKEVCVLKGCPYITDVFNMEEILRMLGAVTWWEGHDLHLDCSRADRTEVPVEYAGKMRCSVILTAAILGRNRKAVIGYPGGCVIGKRPIDLHMYALKCLGAEIRENGDAIEMSCSKLQGCEIRFVQKSVGATEQALLGAVLACGDTIIKNCAREPEIVWLCRFFRKMGAVIEGEGSDCIRVCGVRELHGAKMQIPGDRIVAGTYICAAAATRGRIILENVPPGELDSFLAVYQKMGGQYEWKSGTLLADGRKICYPIPFLETEVYPGFPTDLQSPLLAVLATIRGESMIKENIFENRFKICRELVKMGADIEVQGNCARVRGGSLHGCRIRAEELRGGAALLIAALAAEGESVLEGCSFIRRGYENICGNICEAGGLITEDTGNIFYEDIQLREN